MALLWCDGFDHYGDDETKMTDGVYDQVDAEFTLSSSNPRTGNFCLKRDAVALDSIVKYNFDDQKTTVGFGLSVITATAPLVYGSFPVATLFDQNGQAQCTLMIEPNGKILLKRGDFEGVIIASSESGSVHFGIEYYHIEFAVRAQTKIPEVSEVLFFNEMFLNDFDEYTIFNQNLLSIVSTSHGNGAKITNTEVFGASEDLAFRSIPSQEYTRITFYGTVDANQMSSINADIAVMNINNSSGANIFQIVLARQPHDEGAGSNQRCLISSTLDFDYVGTQSLTVGETYFFELLPDWDSGILSYTVTDEAGLEFASGAITFDTSIKIERLALDANVSLGEPLGDAGTFADIRFYKNSTSIENDGIAEARINGVTVFSESGISTIETSTLEYSGIKLMFGSSLGHGVESLFDDFYIWDDSGAWNNSFIGDRRCFFLKPNQDTNIADFDPSSGNFGYKMIDDSSPDDDSTYIIAEAYLQSGSPLSGTSEFAIEDLTNGASLISGVNVFARASKTDTTSASLYTSITYGANSLSGESHTLTTSYQYYNDIYEYNPSTIANITTNEAKNITISLTADDLESSVVAESPDLSGSPADSEFDPSQLFSGGQDGFWFDFSDTGTLWQDTGATSPVTASGQTIARADDKTGNGYNATQSTAGARPTFNDSSGIKWANYDGGDRLTIASSTASLAWLHKDVGFGMAALVRFGTVANPGAAYGVLGNGAGSTGNVGIYWFFDDRPSQGRDEAMRVGMVRGSGGTFVYNYDSGNGDLTANVDHSVYINTPASGPMNGLVDNVSVGTQAKSLTESSANASFNMDIGTLGNNVLPLVGRIYQIIVRDQEFSTQELSDIQAYFESKLV